MDKVMNKYQTIYETLCPDDALWKDDPRRLMILAEVRDVCCAKTQAEAEGFIFFWAWDSPLELTKWVSRARQLYQATLARKVVLMPPDKNGRPRKTA